MGESGRNVDGAASLLRKDELVAIPTETVYGLAGNALSEKAVRKIFEVKSRPHFNPLIVHIASRQDLPLYVEKIPEGADQLAVRFWPGPLTLLLPKKPVIPAIVTADLPTVAIRVPNHHLTLALLGQLDFPLAAPSANPFGYISPTQADHVRQQLGGRVSYILDGGPCHRGLESTIVGFEEGCPVIFRLGAISVEEIEAEVGDVQVRTTAVNQQPGSPGQLKSHYAPRTPLILCDDLKAVLIRYEDKEKIGLVVYTQRRQEIPLQNQEWLSGSGGLEEAARNLYAALHRLDKKGLKIILAEKFPETGLGRALNDRLRRAETKFKI